MERENKTVRYDERLFEKLQNPKEAAAYLIAALEDEDPHVLIMAMKDVGEAFSLRLCVF